MEQPKVKEPYINTHAFDKVGVPLVWLCVLTRFAERHEERVKNPGISESLLNGFGKEAKIYLGEYLDEIEEDFAKSIYEGWKDQEGWVPWVERGNSLKQKEARSQAKDELVYLANLVKESKGD